MSATAATITISDARAELAELVTRARMLGEIVTLTQRGKPRAAIVPAELADAIAAVGGAGKALEILRRHTAGS